MNLFARTRLQVSGFCLCCAIAVMSLLIAYPASSLALSYYYQGETDQAWLAVQTLLDDHLDSEYRISLPKL